MQLQRGDLGSGGIRLRACAQHIRLRTVPGRIQLLSQLQGLRLAGSTLLDDRQTPKVVVDGRLITGQNPQSATGVGEALRDLLLAQPR